MPLNKRPLTRAFFFCSNFSFESLAFLPHQPVMNLTKNFILGALFIFGTFLISGCATKTVSSADQYTSFISNDLEDNLEAESDNKFTSDRSRRNVLETRKLLEKQDLNYQVGPDDVLEISIFEWQAEGSRDTLDLRVSKAGEIAMPGLGPIQVGGMSVEDIQEYLVNELQDAGIIEVNPRVGVSIKEFRSKRVSVVGAVVAPGIYALTENVAGLQEIISLAGGMSAGAGNTAYVTRKTMSGPDPVQIEIDLDELFRTGAADLDAVLSDGDTVYIPKTENVTVYGEVRNNGRVQIVKSLTLMEAISEAGGVTDEAEKSIVRIERRIGPNRKKNIPVNLAAVEVGNAEDILLQGGDVIYVPENKSKKNMKETFDFFRGIFSASYRIN